MWSGTGVTRAGVNPTWTAAGVGLLLALPWLMPVSGGPSPNVQPWLFTAACACVISLLWAGTVPLRLAAALLALAAWAWVGSPTSLDTFALAGGALLILIAAAAARAVASGGGERPIALAWLAAALVSTAIALMQYFGVGHWLGPLASASPDAEAYANLRQRNQFASLTVIGVAACLWAVWRGASSRAWWLAAVVLAVGNAATTSRTGLLELFALAALAAA